jgi:archaellum component FlaC
MPFKESQGILDKDIWFSPVRDNSMRVEKEISNMASSPVKKDLIVQSIVELKRRLLRVTLQSRYGVIQEEELKDEYKVKSRTLHRDTVISEGLITPRGSLVILIDYILEEFLKKFEAFSKIKSNSRKLVSKDKMRDAFTEGPLKDLPSYLKALLRSILESRKIRVVLVKTEEALYTVAEWFIKNKHGTNYGIDLLAFYIGLAKRDTEKYQKALVCLSIEELEEKEKRLKSQLGNYVNSANPIKESFPTSSPAQTRTRNIDKNFYPQRKTLPRFSSSPLREDDDAGFINLNLNRRQFIQLGVLGVLGAGLGAGLFVINSRIPAQKKLVDERNEALSQLAKQLNIVLFETNQPANKNAVEDLRKEVQRVIHLKSVLEDKLATAWLERIYVELSRLQHNLTDLESAGTEWFNRAPAKSLFIAYQKQMAQTYTMVLPQKSVKILSKYD